MSTYHPNVLVFAIPNGGIRDSITAKKLKDEGVVAGIPDLFVADGKPGLFIEMKEPNGKLSKSQKEIIPRLELAGYPVSVCYGYEAAKKAVNKYLSSEAN
jgi:hypothetical protein